MYISSLFECPTFNSLTMLGYLTSAFQPGQRTLHNGMWIMVMFYAILEIPFMMESGALGGLLYCLLHVP